MSATPDVFDQPIELVSCVLAERAELIDGKLYLFGGAFDRVQAHLPFAVDFHLALVLSVPWSRLQEPYELTTELADADGIPYGPRMHASLESHVPEGYRPGVALTVPLVLPVSAELPHPGRYAVSCTVDGTQSRRVGFELLGADTPGR